MGNRALRDQPASRGAGNRLRNGMASLEPVLLGATGLAAVLVAWEVLAIVGTVNPLLLASPMSTARAFIDLFATGEIWPHILASARLLLTGYAIAVVLGVLSGLLAGWFSGIQAVMAPHVALLYATPSVALMPLFIVWFGLGLLSQIVVVILLAFFPCYYAGMTAIQTTDRSLLRMARSFAAKDRKIFTAIVLPGSLPHIMSGLRLSFGKAIIGTIVVELYAGGVGLGHLLIVFGNGFKTAEVFSVIAIIGIFGLMTQELLGWLERRFDSWRPAPDLKRNE